jgi:hypothetical protein
MGQAMKRNLTDRTLKSLKPTKAGTHADVWDSSFPGFGVRVSDTGRRTFVLTARYPGSKNPTYGGASGQSESHYSGSQAIGSCRSA